VEKCLARQALDENMAHAGYLRLHTHIHTQNMYTYHYSTTIKVAETRFSVTGTLPVLFTNILQMLICRIMYTPTSLSNPYLYHLSWAKIPT